VRGRICHERATRIGRSEVIAVSAGQLRTTVIGCSLESLAAVDERKSRVIEMRFFGGMTVEETAEVLQVSPDTVKRDWRLAKLWLLRELEVGH
jgi:DNA-directed RNA polymerase specialized sigma24 family protein